MSSLRIKLIVMVVLTVGITFIGSLMVFSLAVSSRIASLEDLSLSEQMGDIAAALSWQDGRIAVDVPVSLRRDYRTGAGQFIYIVSDENGRILDSFGSTQHLRPLDISAKGLNDNMQLFSTLRELGGNELKFFAAEKWFTIGPDKWVNIQVGQGPAHEDVLADEILFEMFERNGLLIGGLIASLIGGVIFIVNQLTGSLRQLEKQAITIHPGAQDQKLQVARVPSELVPLVSQINEALRRLNEAYVMQKNYSDMAAHELRSPLAIVRCQAEALADSAEKNMLLDDIANMEQVLTRLMQLSRSESAMVGAHQSLELGETLGEILSEIGGALIRDGMQLSLTRLPQPVHINADQAMLEVMLRNLLDNAAAGGADSTVTISYDATGSVFIADNGPGVPDDKLSKIFDRFVRLSDSTTDGHAGLGLAIVRALADAQNASVSAHHADMGGLEIRLAFSLSAVSQL